MKNSWKVATGRAVASALVVGGASALAMWSQTDELKFIIIAGGTPALGILGARLGVEGAVDAKS